MKNPNIAVIKIGYNSFAFESAQAALELMTLMSQAVCVEEENWSLREETPCTHFLSEEQTLPELKFVAANKFNPRETPKEAKERFAREKKDREDMEQQFRETPPALPAPEVSDE